MKVISWTAAQHLMRLKSIQRHNSVSENIWKQSRQSMRQQETIAYWSLGRQNHLYLPFLSLRLLLPVNHSGAPLHFNTSCFCLHSPFLFLFRAPSKEMRPHFPSFSFCFKGTICLSAMFTLMFSHFILHIQNPILSNIWTQCSAFLLCNGAFCSRMIFIRSPITMVSQWPYKNPDEWMEKDLGWRKC